MIIDHDDIPHDDWDDQSTKNEQKNTQCDTPFESNTKTIWTKSNWSKQFCLKQIPKVRVYPNLLPYFVIPEKEIWLEIDVKYNITIIYTTIITVQTQSICQIWQS